MKEYVAHTYTMEPPLPKRYVYAPGLPLWARAPGSVQPTTTNPRHVVWWRIIFLFSAFQAMRCHARCSTIHRLHSTPYPLQSNLR